MPNKKAEMPGDFDGHSFNDVNELASIMKDKLVRSFMNRTFSEILEVNFTEMSLDKKMALVSAIESNKLQFSLNMFIGRDRLAKSTGYHDSVLPDLMKSAAILEVIGCSNLSTKMRELFSASLLEYMIFDIREEAYIKKVISEDRRKAKLGKKNKHYDEALTIAKNTWSKYPHASLGGLAEEICAHLRTKYNGVPSSETFYKWLKESGVNPDIKPKNRNFKLVLSDRG